MADNKIVIKNKKASFNYEFIEKYVAGIQLTGTEIKSVRNGKVNLVDSYCRFEGNELFVYNMSISEYEYGTHFNHEARRVRKLLLNRRELKKLDRYLREKGYTIIATKMFVNERNLAKLEIALARGKKLYDKREDIKKKDLKRDLDRLRKF
jgi:SsrA-binding protein